MEDKFALARKRLVMILALSIVVVPVIELALFFCVERPGGTTWSEYGYAKFAFPLILSVLMFITLIIVLSNPNIKGIVKNYCCMFAFIFMCAVLVTSHNEYPVLLTIFVIPVLFSVIFEDKSLCSVTHIVSQMGVLQMTVTSKLFAIKPQVHMSAQELASRLTKHVGESYRSSIEPETLLEWSENVRVNSLWLNILLAIALVAIARIFAYAMLLHLQQKDSMLQSHEKDNMALEKQLLRDQMTGLYNHTAFYEFLDRCVKMKGDAPLTLAVVDIDDFKKVNDTYGHDNGDEVILTLSNVLLSHCGSDNYVCRFGGEEFAVIFPNSREKDARKIMTGVLEEFREIRYDWHSGTISFSCGVFQCSPYRMNAEEFFQITDKLLYKAKQNGKNQICGGQ
ncbi:MAG: GGDEF domain-containing protein [Lachnospiraceae bacterium]|nr:GGDEF domain-containing protein [Lachnospiraceae bacterium]